MRELPPAGALRDAAISILPGQRRTPGSQLTGEGTGRGAGGRSIPLYNV